MGTMNKAATGLGVVPEKYQRTRFTASCWFHLAKNAQLSFEEYQRISKDRVCRQSIFEQVKKDMELDRLFNHAEAVYPPDPSDAPVAKPKALPPPQPSNPAMKEALIAGIGRTGGQTPKGPVTPSRRAESDDWIRTHLDAGYALFKEHFTEPDLDKAWFDKIRKTALEPKQETPEMPPATKIRTGDAQKIRDYIQKIPRSKLEDMTEKEYAKASGHKLKSPAAFYAEKRNLLKGKVIRVPGGTKAAKIGRPGRAAEYAPAAGTLFSTLAELPVADFKCTPKDLREVALALVKVLHPRGAEAKVVILSEPHVLEIRVPFQ